MNQNEYTIKVKPAFLIRKTKLRIELFFVALLQIKGTLLKVTLVDHVLDLSRIE
jgi:hypothetical protein